MRTELFQISNKLQKRKPDFQTKKILKKSKSNPVSCLQQVDLNVFLNLNEKNVGYHFTGILVITGLHLCKRQQQPLGL